MPTSAAQPPPPATFVTARLVARRPRADDAPEVLAAYASDPEVTRYLAWPPYTRVEPLTAFLGEAAANWDKRDRPVPLAWLLCLKGTDTPIGSIGVTLEGQGRAMFGYVLAKKFWGHGFTAEALTYLVDWALSRPDIYRAYAFCDVENPSSARVMEKAGMTREGILRRWHIAPTLGPEPRDCIICAKVR